MDIITYALSKKGIIKINGSEYKPAAIGENGQIIYKKLPEYTTFRIGQFKARSAGTLNLLGNREQPIEELYINNVAQELPTGVFDIENEMVVTNYEVNPGDVVKIKGGFSLMGTELPLENVVLQSDLTSCEGMFIECTGVTVAPKIPEGVTSCNFMFGYCTSLTEAPVIPNSVTNCMGMFVECTSLTKAPVIPSSATDCMGMFIMCIGLTEAPVIPSSVRDCSYMFEGCSNLTTIPQENIDLMKNPPEGLICEGCYNECPLVADEILPSWGGKLGEYTIFTAGESGTLKLANISSRSITELYIDNVSQKLPTGTSYSNTSAYTVENGQKIKIKGNFSLYKTTLLIKDIMLQNDLESYKFMFYGCTSLTEAPVMPNSVTNCSYMFYGCTSLTEVPVIPITVTDCGSMFQNCTSLTIAPIIPSSVTDCNYMFYGCTSLTESPVIPNSVTNCSSMFASCTNLTTAQEIPNSVTNCSFMFQNCTSLTTAPVIPNSVTSCSNMFNGCTSLAVIPQENMDLMNNPREGLSYDNCYKGCQLVSHKILPSWGGELGLYTTFTIGEAGTLKVANIQSNSITELYIDNVVQQLPTGTSYDSTNIYTVKNGQKIKIKGSFSLNGTAVYIKDIILQNDLESCYYMFKGCSGLTQAPIIPNSVTDCGDMFNGCYYLTQAPVIPNKATNCESMFKGCTRLTEAPDIPSLVRSCDSMFYGCTSLTQAPVIPNSVTNCMYMFNNCTSLTQAPVIPNSVTNCMYMFNNCTSLTQAPVIPSSVTNCDSMFIGCTSLTVAPVISSSVKYCNNMFKGCSNLATIPEENINLMNNPREGLSYTDCYKNCPLVADIVLVSWGGNKVEEIPGLYTTFTVGESGTLKVANISRGSIKELYIDNVAQQLPTGTNYYKVSTYTVENGQKIKIKGKFSLNGTTLLINDIILQDGLDCNNMFYGCTGLTKAPQIPEGVYDCMYMFYGCTSLTEAPQIPESVGMCDYMFYGCTSLTQAPAIPNNVTDCHSMFSGCTSLTQAPFIPSSVTNCNSMFSGCTSLTQAPVIPSSVNYCTSMFKGCTSLTVAPVIPSSVGDCGNMFDGCTNLTTLPEENVNLMNNTPAGLIYFGCYSNCSNIVKPITYDQIPDGWK